MHFVQIPTFTKVSNFTYGTLSSSIYVTLDRGNEPFQMGSMYYILKYFFCARKLEGIP